MSYCKYFLFLLVTLFVPLQQEFVSFLPENTVIERKDEKLQITLVFHVKPDFHIQAEDEVPDNFIPTSLSFQSPKENINYYFQIANYDTIVLGRNIHKVISNEFKVLVEIDTKLQNIGVLKGELNYQACDDRQCFFPRKLSFQVSL